LLFETGCTYYDGLVKTLAERRAAPVSEEKRRPVVLVAPTWKPYGFLNRFGRQMIESLLAADKWDVIFRPHPQTAVSFPDVLEDIRKTFTGREHFTLDDSPNGAASMDCADMMISELSGIVFDYAFTQGKPTLIFNGTPDLRGFEAEDFDCEMWEVAVRSQIGVEFGVEDIPIICSLVERTLKRSAGDLAEFRDANIYNFGNAGPVAADQICEIMNKEDV
jgi:CDP-glycerol glycerophosphotransferase (TagB/SpsB family)